MFLKKSWICCLFFSPLLFFHSFSCHCDSLPPPMGEGDSPSFKNAFSKIKPTLFPANLCGESREIWNSNFVKNPATTSSPARKQQLMTVISAFLLLLLFFFLLLSSVVVTFFSRRGWGRKNFLWSLLTPATFGSGGPRRRGSFSCNLILLGWGGIFCSNKKALLESQPNPRFPNKVDNPGPDVRRTCNWAACSHKGRSGFATNSRVKANKRGSCVYVHHFWRAQGQGARLDKCQMKDVAKKLRCTVLVGEFCSLRFFCRKKREEGRKAIGIPTGIYSTYAGGQHCEIGSRKQRRGEGVYGELPAVVCQYKPRF